MKRIFDFCLALALLLTLLPLLLVIGLLVRCTSAGPALYWSARVGRDGVLFSMPKFRTMRTDAPAVATHLLTDPDRWLTPIGGMLRQSSLDELPQLWSIVRGQMSFVGPRPALFNQDDLMQLRVAHGVDKLLPGLTGWAQIHGRDELAIPAKVAYEVEYLRNRSFALDLKIMILTVVRVLHRDGVRH